MRTAMLTGALRGVLVGLAVWGTFSLVFDHVEREILAKEAADPVDNGVGVLVAIVGTGLMIGVPASYVVGSLVAWMARLRMPLLVSLAGLFITAVVLSIISCARGSGGSGMPPWVSALVVGASYRLAAALVPLAARRLAPDPAP